MTNNGKWVAGAAVLALAVAGGYMARASLGSGGPVNARPIPVASGSAPASFADIVQRVAPAVVSIETEGHGSPDDLVARRPHGQGGDDGMPPELRRFFPGMPNDDQQAQQMPIEGAGSGFFISADGYIATNNHVIDGADKINVITADRHAFPARVVGRDQTTDLAVLKIEATGMPFVSFEDSAKPRVGDWVVAVGNPFDLGGTATAGIVSALDRRNISGSNGNVDFMQIDAPINRGNSGGPTFDLNGRVVGVNTAIYSPGASGGSVGIGFDIPANVAASVTRQLMAGGKVVRGYIGVSAQDVTPDIAESLSIPAKGAIVAQVVSGGPSQAAGIKAGDVILKVDGQSVDDASDLTRQVGAIKAGSSLKLDLLRDGKPLQVTLQAGVRPAEDQLASAKPAAEPDHSTGIGLGLKLTPEPQGDGVRITGVEDGSPAANIGLQPGDVILRAGGAVVHSAADLTSAANAARAAGRKQMLLMVQHGGRQSFAPIPLAKVRRQLHGPARSHRA